MAYDGKSVWRQNILKDFTLRFLPFVRGEEFVWLDKRISHLEMEIERLRNKQNGLLQKLRIASGKATELTRTASTSELARRIKPAAVGSSNDLATKSYEGDFTWAYYETPLPKRFGRAPQYPDLGPGRLAKKMKSPYIKSIQRWKEKAEFKINKIQDLIDELYRELLDLKNRRKASSEEGAEIEDQVIENRATNSIIKNSQSELTAPNENSLRTVRRFSIPLEGDQTTESANAEAYAKLLQDLDQDDPAS